MNILSHPNIPQLLGVQITCQPYSLIMEFIGQDAKSSTVHQMIEETSTKCSPLFAHEWVYCKGYLNCDLKTNNVLVFNKEELSSILEKLAQLPQKYCKDGLLVNLVIYFHWE